MTLVLAAIALIVGVVGDMTGQDTVSLLGWSSLVVLMVVTAST